ncbi:MAG: metal ABC transporter permease, partial [Muribaculaceae bacterium]|nr:metal ABC transporter permease [Muribaculaceae bacterium]
VSLAGCLGGLWISVLIDVPASAVIVILLAIFYVASLIRRA